MKRLSVIQPKCAKDVQQGLFTYEEVCGSPATQERIRKKREQERYWRELRRKSKKS